MKPTHIFIAGYPKDYGGANTELWHTVRLFRSHGLEVTMLPTWKADPIWQQRLKEVGIDTWLDFVPDKWQPPPALPGSIVIAFCNTLFVDNASRFTDLDCKVVYVPCMTWLFPQERLRYREHDVFDRYVFQSLYQRRRLQPRLRNHGYRDAQGTLIHGAFCLDDFPLEPKAHRPGSRFMVGRLSRTGLDKFPADLWSQYARIPYPTSARVMGWDGDVAEKCGTPPVWTEVLSVNAEPVRSFLASIHALVPGVGCCAENWPRVGLEAMAAGVPVIAESKGGWPEMLGDAGVLCESVDHQAYEVARLAYDPQWRMDRILAGRSRVEDLADSDAVWSQWQTLLENTT